MLCCIPQVKLLNTGTKHSQGLSCGSKRSGSNRQLSLAPVGKRSICQFHRRNHATSSSACHSTNLILEKAALYTRSGHSTIAHASNSNPKPNQCNRMVRRRSEQQCPIETRNKLGLRKHTVLGAMRGAHASRLSGYCLPTAIQFACLPLTSIVLGYLTTRMPSSMRLHELFNPMRASSWIPHPTSNFLRDHTSEPKEKGSNANLLTNLL
eukprot:5773435-Amphidinium_carterae.1